MKVTAIGAAVVGAGLFVAASFTPTQAQVIATVDGKSITEADLRLAEREVGANPGLAPEERRRVLVELVIHRQVLAAAAEQAKLHADKDFDHRLAYARRTLLQQLFVEKHARDAVSEADARRIYDEQAAAIKPEEEVRVRHIVVGSEVKAKELRAVLVKGADFATLAKAQSTDPRSAQQGGGMGWRTNPELPDTLAAAAFALQKQGDLTAPVRTDAGWHLVQLEERRMRTVPAFAELKDHIIGILAQEKARELALDLRSKAKVAYHDPTLKPQAATVTPPAIPSRTAAAVDAAPAPPAPAAPAIAISAAAKASHWRHDGSLMKLYADGERIVLQFEKPREGLDASGIKPGTQLFHGTRRGKTYSGEAITFSPQCGARKFPVTGQAAADGNSFKVLGMRPVLAAGCNVANERSEVLVFEYVGPAAR
jgi:peptidyl-prolyl cis-trans isomerase C